MNYGNDKNIKPIGVSLYFLPVETRVPLKFGPETLTSVTCARVKITVANPANKTAQGWGETPLSVQWVWPGSLTYQQRHEALMQFTTQLANEWAKFDHPGHPMEIGHQFQETKLKELLKNFNSNSSLSEPMPWLAALVCCSAFDIALHDAYAKLHDVPVYQIYNADYMNQDLSHYLTAAEDAQLSFENIYPQDFFVNPPKDLPAWHLVGGKDLIENSELTGSEPDDGYPVLLREWIKRDGLKCLKVKLRGNEEQWDYDRLVKIGKISIEQDVHWLTTDFNCTVKDPEYVNRILDKLMAQHPRIYAMILYVEQPFPYDLENNQIDVHSVSARKPLFMDESCHDWHLIKLGRKLGWTGVALKTCKTQTGALLSMCWAKAHGMTLMVQDLTNPMLAQIPHCLLAAYSGTIMGVETNCMQFYPDASLPEQQVHPGLYQRKNGKVDISTIKGPGFGYCLDRIERQLPEPAVQI
jgi:L-alanine-DL-glutamate epimerase-like enolase superfamily enzyme